MLVNMKPIGRIVACGMMAGYNHQDRPPADLQPVGGRRPPAPRAGLPAAGLPADGIKKALVELHTWVRSGELVVLENVTHGIHQAPETFCRLMAGTTIGKTLVALDGEA